MNKEPFDIDYAVAATEEAVAPFPKAGMFELFDEGYTSPFEMLVACLISIRTYDEVMLPVSRTLFALARTPHEMSHLTLTQIEEAIAKSTFAESKAKQILEIAKQIVEAYDGELPCNKEVLVGFKGVGPKCAHLVLGIACQEPYIAVDIHVHRVTNRWGYVETKSPEQTMKALEEKLPKRYWVDINRLLLPFGKHICKGQAPLCSRCPLLKMCEQRGVDGWR